MEIRIKQVKPSRNNVLAICIITMRERSNGVIENLHPEKYPMIFEVNPIDLSHGFPVLVENQTSLKDQKLSLENLLLQIGRIYAKRNRGELMDCLISPPRISVWFDFSSLTWQVQFRLNYDGKIWVNHICIERVLTIMSIGHYWLEDESSTPKLKTYPMDIKQAANELLLTKTAYEKSLV